MSIRSVPAKLVVRDDLEPVRWNGEEGRFLLRKEDTGGLYTFMEITTSAGCGPPLHIHDAEDEAFLVTEGRYEIQVGERRREAEPGTLVYSPRGAAHQFRNITDGPAKMLLIVTPGGVEEFFIGLSELFSAGRPSAEAVLDLALRHKIRGFEGPPGGRGPG